MVPEHLPLRGHPEGTRLLSVRDLNVYYGPAHILQGVNLTVGAEPLALLGRNGMGKTTLCQALMGLVPIARGAVSFDGRDLTNRKPHQIAASGLGYVPQGRRIFPSLSVAEHLRLVGTGRRRGSDDIPAWTVERVYDLFPRLAERRKSGAASLSGGEQQMLAIGRALLTNPRLLVMDEPSEGLAPVIVDQLVETLKRLSGEGLAILIVEQKLAVAAALADRLVVMVSGQIAVETTAEALLADPDAQRRYLGVAPR
ncbi:MAG: ABC transporter ATP-binding protein [Chloroflexi bacterium]|nr:ABC transporter ATP-binding protein [Chloroflexota bacterium]